MIDEAHCVEEWHGFRPKYNHLADLKLMLPDWTTFYVTSATLDPKTIKHVSDSLGLPAKDTCIIRNSNDRHNLLYAVFPIKHSLQSHLDLKFLVDGATEEIPPRTYMCFHNTRRQAEDAAMTLGSMLPQELQHKIVYIHAGMDPRWRRVMIIMLERGEIWGAHVTDAIGLVSIFLRYTYKESLI